MPAESGQPESVGEISNQERPGYASASFVVNKAGSTPIAPPGEPIGQSAMDFLMGSDWITALGSGAGSNPWLEAYGLPPFRVPGR